MVKIKSIAMLVLLTAPFQVKAATPILPEMTTAVDLSSTDINRIVCPGTINDLIFSKEKGIDGHFVGNNAFVKFKIIVQGNEKKHSTTPTELFVSCNNTIYSLLASPKRIPAVTLRLSPSPTRNIKQNISRYQALPFEKKILQLVQEAYQNEYPDSYRLTKADTLVNLSVDLHVRLVRIVDVEGVGLRLKEYLVKPVSALPVQITEKDFLRAEMGEGIVAVVVENHTLEQSTSRVFIFEQRGAS